MQPRGAGRHIALDDAHAVPHGNQPFLLVHLHAPLHSPRHQVEEHVLLDGQGKVDVGFCDEGLRELQAADVAVVCRAEPSIVQHEGEGVGLQRVESAS